MTKRTANRQRMLEFKERLMTKVANRMFTFKETGIDGFVKKRLMPAPKKRKKASE